MPSARPRAPIPSATAAAEREVERSGTRGHLGDTGRAVATACLCAVLAGLALTVATGSSSGSSTLLRVLHDRLVSPWMTPPWLDVGHDTRLTYGLPEDADHFLEVTPARGAGGAVRVPPAGDRSGAAARWRRLVRAVALAEESGDEDASALATAIGVGLLDRGDGDDLIVRFKRSARTEPGALRKVAAETVHQGRVRRVDGEIQWIPIPPAEEVAPLSDRPREGRR